MALISPKVKPQSKGFKAGDHHIVVNAESRVATIFNFQGVKVGEFSVLAQGNFVNWKQNQGDTPPGLYKIGDVYLDYPNRTDARTNMAFGWVTFDMIDLEGNEDNNGRAGVALHGGGTALGYEGAWAEYQELIPTHGCLRAHNKSLFDKVYPLTKKGTVFISVYQVA